MENSLEGLYREFLHSLLTTSKEYPDPQRDLKLDPLEVYGEFYRDYIVSLWLYTGDLTFRSLSGVLKMQLQTSSFREDRCARAIVSAVSWAACLHFAIKG